MKKYAISDIHGCYKTLVELLNTIGLNKEDEIYFLGDYINKGSRSKKVVDYLIDLKEKGYNLTTLKGNHEATALDIIASKTKKEATAEALKSFGVKHLKKLDKKYTNWFSALEQYYITEDYIFVHAGLDFTKSNPLKNKKDMLLIRNWYDTIDYDWLGNRVIVHGHAITPKKEIKKMLKNIDKQKVIDIDNGCFFKSDGYGNLCCLDLTSKELTFQKNID